MSRAQRLAELQGETAKAAGYAGIAEMVGADRQRAEQVALLRLQFECAAARLVNNGDLVTSELIQLSQAIDAMLPKPAPQKLIIEFADSFDDRIERLLKELQPELAGSEVIRELSSRITELEAQNKSLTEQVASAQREIERLRRGPEQPAAENSHSRPPLSHHEVLPPLRAAPAPRDGSPRAAFADLNAGFGPQCPAAARSNVYLEPDAVDGFGRRIKQT